MRNPQLPIINISAKDVWLNPIDYVVNIRSFGYLRIFQFKSQCATVSIKPQFQARLNISNKNPLV